MEIKISINGRVENITLESHITPSRQVIWIGAPDERVYNTITLEGIDTYQCSIAFDHLTSTWTLTHGQTRTECPRGLLSDRSRACSMCRGCCVSVHTARPTYSLRTPRLTTILNGAPLGTSAIILTGGDTISFE